MKFKPRYFDPYVYEKVLEHYYLPSTANQVLRPWSVKHKQRYLSEEMKKNVEETVEKRKQKIDGFVQLYIQEYLEECSDYLHCEVDKQEWFDELREDYGLPLDFEFE